jgi:carboxylesterase type B
MHYITAPSSHNTSSLFTQAIAQSPAFQPIVNSQETETFEATLKYASLLTNKTITTLAQLKALPFEVLYNVSLLNRSFDHDIKVVAAHN